MELRDIYLGIVSDGRSSDVFSKLSFESDCIEFALPILGSTVSLHVGRLPSGYLVGVAGRTGTARRWVNDSMPPYSRLLVPVSGPPVHVVASRLARREVVGSVFECAELVKSLRAVEESGAFSEGSTVPMYWSSGILNFGDWCGPHIVQRASGRIPIQANRATPAERVTYSVGSILGWIKRNNVDIWGSGLMKPLSDQEVQERRRLSGVRVHAVRGTLTQEFVADRLGWSVPDVFGDPALLLPSLYTPTVLERRPIAVVPHGIHRAQFSDVVDDEVRVVDVRADFRDVVDQIASSSRVISTSLHGVIVAQAFGVPWVWLHVPAKPLMGDRFKFEDFFSCLERGQVAEVSADLSTVSLPFLRDIAQGATLPELLIDLSVLRDSLPCGLASVGAPRASSRKLDEPL